MSDKDGSSPSAVEGEPPRVSVWDDIPLHVTKWVPREEVTLRAIVFVAHGIGEHMGRYDDLGLQLAKNGILAFSHDHVGHGKSGGDRVHINEFATYVRDVVNHVRDAKEAYPAVPCFLMGHSMGGLVAALVAIDNQDLFTGVIFSSAGVEVDPNVAGPVLKFFAKVLAFVLPQVGVKAVDTRLISSLPEEVEMYETDPLVYHMAIKAKWIVEFMNAIETARPQVNAINIPALLFHGDGDRLVPISASEFLFSNILSEDKTFEVFEGSYHEVLHDKEQERARDLIKDWILAHGDLQR